MAAYDPSDPGGNGGDPYASSRQKAVTSAQAAGQNGMDAIARRYAAMGNMNSGSYTQAVADNARSTQQTTQDSLAGIDAQQATQSLPFKQQQIQNTFQGGQNQAQLAQQESQFSRQLPLQQRQLDLEASQQGLDKQANDINQQLGQEQLDKSGGLFGGGGFLGLGLGGSGSGGGGGGTGDTVKKILSGGFL